jgi:type III restriction enzyme
VRSKWLDPSQRRVVVPGDKLVTYDCGCIIVDDVHPDGVISRSSGFPRMLFLGRVLRLPAARGKRNPELNEAYAFVVSPNFADAAQNLRDALVEAGFEKFETQVMVQPVDEQPSLFYPTIESPLRALVQEIPDADKVAALPNALRAVLEIDETAQELILSAPLSREDEEAVVGVFSTEAAREAVRNLATLSRDGLPRSTLPTARAATPIRLPQLAIDVDGILEIFEDSHFLSAPWRLADADASLSDSDFPPSRAAGQAGTIDVTGQGRIELTYQETVSAQLALLEGEPGWTVTSLTLWLDRHIPHPDLPQSDVQHFIRRAIESLLEQREISVEQLAREKARLLKALAAKIDSHRRKKQRESYQQLLFGETDSLHVDQRISMEIGDADTYSPNWIYSGPYRFRRHLFPTVGELRATGEEHDAAVYLDQHPAVDRWVRNIQRPSSFWLQTSTDRFYPDFVGALSDGRVFAVEAKGAHLWSNDDSKEKRAVGELWAARSGGHCIFVMPNGPDWAVIAEAFET